MAVSTTVKSAAPASDSRSLKKQLQGMLSMLSVMFLLGLAMATVGDYDAGAHTGNKAVHGTLLGLHALIALGLLVGSIRCLAMLRNYGVEGKKFAVVGLLAILLSIGTGMARTSVDNEWLTFLMGTGFVVAMGAYGGLLGLVQKGKARAAN